MKRKLTLLGMMAAVILLLACGAEPSPSAVTDPTAPPARATATPPPTIPPTAASAPGPTIVASPVLAPTPTEPAGAAAATRERPEPTPVPASTETATTVPPTPTVAPERNPEEDVLEIRRIIAEYWNALNDYDVDHALTMLEEGYRAQEEEPIRKDIGRMKLFRVKLGVSEKSPPTLNADGDYETLLGLKTPVDSREARMVFRKIEGRWWIVYSGQVN